MGNQSDVLQDIADRYGIEDDDLQAIKDASPLRKRIADLTSEVADLKPKAERLEQLEAKPKVVNAFAEYGVDMENLRPAERRAIESLQAPDNGATPEWVATHVQELELPVIERQAGSEEDQPNAAAITQQATAPSGSRRPQTSSITAVEAAAWAVDQQMRFAEQHPDEWEVLKQGGTVTGVIPPA